MVKVCGDEYVYFLFVLPVRYTTPNNNEDVEMRIKWTSHKWTLRVEPERERDNFKCWGGRGGGGGLGYMLRSECSLMDLEGGKRLSPPPALVMNSRNNKNNSRLLYVVVLERIYCEKKKCLTY